MPTSTLPSLPPISTLASQPASTRTSVLALLFEPSPGLQSLSLPVTTAPHASYASLITAVGSQLRGLAASEREQDAQTLQEILSSHPRLGEKKVESALSRAEQEAMVGAGAGDGTEGESDEGVVLSKLNAEYERAFPGLRYVVFVNGRPRSVIFEDMRRRIGRGDIGAEREEAIRAMCDIAADRARKLQSDQR